jgi:hypothetical protein
MRAMGRWAIVAIAALMCACASAGMSDDSDKSDDPGPDANRNIDLPDASVAPPRPDAASVPAMPDAAVTVPLPDAGVGTGPFCSSHADCAVSGECCVSLGQPPGFCAPGTEIGSICVPD